MTQSTTFFICKTAAELDKEICSMIHNQNLRIVSIVRVSEFTPDISGPLAADYFVVFERGLSFDPPLTGYQG